MVIIVPHHGDLRKERVRLHHDALYSGHLGRDRTQFCAEKLLVAKCVQLSCYLCGTLRLVSENQNSKPEGPWTAAASSYIGESLGKCVNGFDYPVTKDRQRKYGYCGLCGQTNQDGTYCAHDLKCDF